MLQRALILKIVYRIGSSSGEVKGWLSHCLLPKRLGCALFVVLNLALVACFATLPTTDSVHLLLGNPSGAIANLSSPNNYLIVRPQYALSYNRSHATANWVSWQLNRSWLGDLPRGQFEPDADLPTDWYRVAPRDYTGSGFDRGHLVPAGDRDRTAEDRRAVFVMTNIIPQAPDNNQGPWEELESYCRYLVRQGKELYIVAGGAGVGGTGERGGRQAIASGKVIVPGQTWKIVVVLDTPGAAISDIDASTRVIAVVMPNRQGIREASWRRFRVSVDEIEQLTGYDFLSSVSTEIQEVVEAKVDAR